MNFNLGILCLIVIFVAFIAIFIYWTINVCDNHNTPDTGDLVAFKSDVSGGAIDGVVIEVVEMRKDDWYKVSYKGQDGKIHKKIFK